jgi:hypothetical protein
MEEAAIVNGATSAAVDVLAEQQKYYCARAQEYDDWWHRRGSLTTISSLP